MGRPNRNSFWSSPRPHRSSAMPSSWTGRHPHRGRRPASGFGIDAPEGRQISQERRRPAASDLDNHCPARRLLIVCPIGSQPRRWRSRGTCILLDRHRKRSSSVSLSFKNSVTLRATSLVRLSSATVEVLPRWIVSRSDTTRERQLCADFVEKPLNWPLVEKWFRRCDSLV